MGEFDIPFSFFCPNCKVNINGIRKIATENSLEINNATEIEECLDNIDYYVFVLYGTVFFTIFKA